MADNPVDLDEYRGIVARMETEIRRERSRRLLDDQASLRRRHQELEAHLHADPAETWEEAAAKAEYLLQLFAATQQAQEPQMRELIACVLEDLERLRQREKESS